MQYEDAGPFVLDRAFVMKDSLYGVIDTKNQIIVPLKYEKVSYYYSENKGDTIIWGWNGEQTTAHDLRGKILPNKNQYGRCGGVYGDSMEGIRVYKEDDLYGIKLVRNISNDLNLAFESVVILKPKYKWLIKVDRDTFLAFDEWECGAIINQKDSALTEFKYDWLVKGKGTFIQSRIDTLYGGFYANGKLVSEPQFKYIYHISDYLFMGTFHDETHGYIYKEEEYWED